MNVLIPMGGSMQVFRDHGYVYPKNIIELKRRPLIQHVYDNLRQLDDARFIFVVRKEEAQKYHLDSVLELLDPACVVIRAEGDSAGAACTALLAIQEINNDDELVIANGDQIIAADLNAAIAQFRACEWDGGTLTFDSVHPRWSYVRLNDQGYVSEAAEKRPISRHATVGIYYFKHGRYFVEAAMAMIRKDARVDDRFFICPSFNEMVLQAMRIGVHTIDRSQYFSLSTPQDIEAYERFLDGRSNAL